MIVVLQNERRLTDGLVTKQLDAACVYVVIRPVEFETGEFLARLAGLSAYETADD